MDGGRRGGEEEAIFHKDLSGKYLMEETSRVGMR